jgi:methyl-accepting chemotaxis protein
MLKKMKMGTKLIGGFLVVALIAAVVGITGIVNIHKVAKADLGLFQDSLVPLPVLADLRVGLQAVRVAARDELAARTDAEIRESD